MPVTEELDGHKFFTRQGAKRVATPLFAALVVVELTDVVFAIDSVPAILAVSHEPFIVFASNAFAILGLRAMYFLLANAKARFHYLSHALGAILVFVGVKMTVSHWYHLDTYLSLAVIVAILAGGIVFSERRNRSPNYPQHGGGVLHLLQHASTSFSSSRFVIPMTGGKRNLRFAQSRFLVASLRRNDNCSEIVNY